jgi:tRNA(Ile)-lysidine synthase
MSKFESSPVTQAFQHQIDRSLPDSSRLIAGVSGGPDSMALLYLLHRFNLDAIVVHCNYMLRGEESDKDQELVENFSALWGFECVSVRLEPEETGNFQSWARERRYEIFHDLKREFDANFIVTAHHLDDQVETILQRILRGSGLSSWSGMKAIEKELFRPLLDVTKSDILQFVQDFKVPYRIDNTNEESTYARNFLRHNWFPELDRLFPGWKTNLLKVPRRAAEFDGLAEKVLSVVAENQRVLNREKFLELDEGIRPAVLHRFISQSHFSIAMPGSLEMVASDLNGLDTGQSIRLDPEHKITRDRTRYVLQKNEPDLHRPVTIERDHLSQVGAVFGYQLEVKAFKGKYEPEKLYLDSSRLDFPITVRNWKEGDQIQPLGMNGRQLISDHLTNRKISATQKKDALVIESFDGNICAVIFPHKTEDGQIGTISETVRCNTETKHVLIIRNK